MLRLLIAVSILTASVIETRAESKCGTAYAKFNRTHGDKIEAHEKRRADAAQKKALFCEITREETIPLYKRTIVQYQRFISCLDASDHAHSVIDIAREALAQSRKFVNFCKSEGL
jgi:hypothetical protein